MKLIFSAALLLSAGQVFADYDHDWAGGPYFGRSPSVISSNQDVDGYLASLPPCTAHQMNPGQVSHELGGVRYYTRTRGDENLVCRVGTTVQPTEVVPE